MEGDRRRDITGDRKLLLSIPPRSPLKSSLRHYPSFSFPSSPFSSPLLISSTSAKRRSSSSFSSLFLLLFSLRSLYSLLPFLRSSPSNFSLFPFSFLVSFFSLVLTAVCFSLAPSPDPSRLRPLPQARKLLPLILAKSLLLALGFLLRFQSLRTCGTAATILIEFSGSVVASSLSRSSGNDRRQNRKIRGLVALAAAFVLLSLGWDRVGCFPLSSNSADGKCFKILPLLLPFLSGSLGFYEYSSFNWMAFRDLGQRRLRLLSLGISTAILFFPALISFIFSDDFGVENFGWSLANTVIFGVVLSGMGCVPLVKDFRREFLSTFFCTIALELFYNPRISLAGFLVCCLLLWVSVDQLAPPLRTSSELEDPQFGDSLVSMVSKPLRHIWSERKSRKIFLFLVINSAYMLVEFTAGFFSNSLGLISDACHMLFDCAALAIGLYASYISRLPASSQFNYGRGRLEVLSGYVNAVFLVLVGALIVLESFERILDPQEISTSSVLSVSVGGLLVNLVGLVFFHEEHHHAHGGRACSHSHQEHSHKHHVAHHHPVTCDHKHHDHGTGDASSSADLHHSDQNHYHHAVQHHSHSPAHDGHDHKHCDHSISPVPKQPENNHHQHSAHHNSPFPDYHQGGHDDSPSDKSHHPGTDNHSHSHSEPNHRHHAVHHHSYSPDHHLGGSDHEHVDHSHHHGKVKHARGSKEHHLVDHNMQGVFLHVLADTMGSVGVVISTLLIKYKGWMVADPACSIIISIMIVSSVIPLLKNSAEILLQRVPRIHEVELKEAVNEISRMNGIFGVDHTHFWSFTMTDIVGTIHLRVSADCDRVLARKQVLEKLQEVGVNDLTVQMEYV